MKGKNQKPQHKKKRSERPFVFVNFAMTADGKTAFADHRFKPFASVRDREHMLELRATADAVMSGARTIDQGPVTLGTGGAKFRRRRQQRGLSACHLRIIVTGSGSVNLRAEIFKHDFSPIVILTTRRAGTERLKQLRALAQVKICGAKQINFLSALRWLRSKWNVKRLLCEGGGELSGALFRAGLVDELHLTVSPKMFGGRTAPTIAEGKGFEKLSAAAAFQFKSQTRAGDEMFFVFTRKHG
ncbi:MAG: dihydrofolate reductase family protein [Verrucomicrobiota bacterium]